MTHESRSLWFLACQPPVATLIHLFQDNLADKHQKEHIVLTDRWLTIKTETSAIFISGMTVFIWDKKLYKR